MNWKFLGVDAGIKLREFAHRRPAQLQRLSYCVQVSCCGPLRNRTKFEVGVKRCLSTSIWNRRPVKTFACSCEYSAEPRRRTSPALLLAQGRCVNKRTLVCDR